MRQEVTVVGVEQRAVEDRAAQILAEAAVTADMPRTAILSLELHLRNTPKERPLTHDLMGHLMTALGAHVERVIINDLKNATYYARMIIRAENELQQKKIIELDGRPSDCIAMATQQKAPMYVSQEVWDEVDDMSDVLRKMEEEGIKPDGEPESESESSEEE